jgi:hypothetical protein
MSQKTHECLIKEMAHTLATCHGLLDERRVHNSEVDMSWVFDDIEKLLSDARTLLGTKIPALPVIVDEDGNEKVIRPF